MFPGSLDLKDKTIWTTIERDANGEMVTKALEMISSENVLPDLTVTGIENSVNKDCFVIVYKSASGSFEGYPVII